MWLRMYALVTSRRSNIHDVPAVSRAAFHGTPDKASSVTLGLSGAALIWTP